MRHLLNVLRSPTPGAILACPSLHFKAALRIKVPYRTWSLQECRRHSTRPSQQASTHWRPRPITNDTLLYENPDQSFYRVAYFCAGGQLLLWLTFADWCWRELQVSKENPDGSKEYVLAPRLERTGAAAFCLSIGGLFAAAVHLWSSRRVRALTVLKGGQYIGIDTSNLLGKNRVVIQTRRLRTWERAYKYGDAAPADRWKGQTSTFSKVAGHRAYIILKPETHRTGFMVDRSGEFLEPQLFDFLFYKKA
ncbi:uncharacterized protein SPPG_00819 [Spizellomyces punctatus DAOM BR117]|uniref:Transmembrane protein 223 n=1 Tax=Spizellomyces punctatus (strain DAOM BR117) TaxID=645134 RepID=A0A0L0HW71_SPIPD|nr:uncharacterized protein SPPG_00819 [Spizellomyces punctatus DAOM BR117]KND05150.1 hypothetical protein SPPG_00819 [Spizellomyces punctatus DAOM BR117]|eukprot:XP_016613189.1 hypothetical protein SPPG_00819 [Spizellomyces punctatus DAOM BR117]